MLAPEYELDVTTHNGVMAHLTYLHKNWVVCPGPHYKDTCLF